MARQREFRVLVATDGSPAARAAVAAAAVFPWPRRTRIRGVVARRMGAAAGGPVWVRAALHRGFERVAAAARRALARRWRDAEVVLADRPPVEAILTEARRFGARAIVLGWSGHGAVRRLLMGSVSRAVVREAKCPVLVVRRLPRAMRAFVVGLDGSRNARRAARFLAGLGPPRGGRVTVVRVVEPVAVPSAGLLPAAVRATIQREAAAVNAGQLARARRDVDRVAAALRRAGWKARAAVHSGAPLGELLAAVEGTKADALVVGARGVGRLERLLLGSVTEGALNRSTGAVLVVR